MDKSVTAAAASQGSPTDVTVDVTFEPSSVGDTRAVLLVSSSAGGDYMFPLTGVCLPPKPQVTLYICLCSNHLPVYYQFVKYAVYVKALVCLSSVWNLSTNICPLTPRHTSRPSYCQGRSPVISSCCSHHMELSPFGYTIIFVFIDLPSAFKDISFLQILYFFSTFIRFRGLWNRNSCCEPRKKCWLTLTLIDIVLTFNTYACWTI